MPLDGVAAAFGAANVTYAQGAPYAEGVVLPVPRTLLHPDKTTAQQGLNAEYFPTAAMTGKPLVTRVDPQIDFDWNSASPVPGADQSAFAVRWTGTIAMPAAGSYELSMRLAHCYPCGDRERFAVYLDGKQLSTFDHAPSEGRESSSPRFTVTVADNSRHDLRVEYQHNAPLFGAGLTA